MYATTPLIDIYLQVVKMYLGSEVVEVAPSWGSSELEVKVNRARQNIPENAPVNFRDMYKIHKEGDMVHIYCERLRVKVSTNCRQVYVQVSCLVSKMLVFCLISTIVSLHVLLT